MEYYCKKIIYDSKKKEKEMTFNHTFIPLEKDGIFELENYKNKLFYKKMKKLYPKNDFSKYSKFRISILNNELIKKIQNYENNIKNMIEKQKLEIYKNKKYFTILKKEDDVPYINLKINLHYENRRKTDIIHKKIYIYKNNKKIENISIFQLNKLKKKSKIKVYFRPLYFWINEKYYGITFGLLYLSFNDYINKTSK